jgi:hypothetical protein
MVVIAWQIGRIRRPRIEVIAQFTGAIAPDRPPRRQNSRNDVSAGSVKAAKFPIHAVWPPSKVPLAKTRLFADFLAARLKREHL